ncbi:hypothetical protein DRO41_00320 [Candidatus Bathyarchaeota archaeon]|nr:MAG: hypothetical protein DRO41_00320 [Candidatus Bathyarchaeota archaeon]
MRGFIIEVKSNRVVGIWTITFGSLFVSTPDDTVKRRISKGILRSKPTIYRGKLFTEPDYIQPANATLAELTEALSPDYVCVAEEDMEEGAIKFPPQEAKLTSNNLVGLVTKDNKVVDVWCYAGGEIKSRVRPKGSIETNEVEVSETSAGNLRCVTRTERAKKSEPVSLGEISLATPYAFLPMRYFKWAEKRKS